MSKNYMLLNHFSRALHTAKSCRTVKKMLVYDKFSSTILELNPLEKRQFGLIPGLAK